MQRLLWRLSMAFLPEARPVAVAGLSVCLALHMLIVFGEFGMPHATVNARYAARLITHGQYRLPFWLGAVVVGGVVPGVLLAMGAAGIAGLFALAGLLIFEWCFIMAGQSVPNS